MRARDVLAWVALALLVCGAASGGGCAVEEDHPLAVPDTTDGPDEVVVPNPDKTIMTPDQSARHWGKAWCDMGYQELGGACYSSHYNPAWRSGCYSWMDSTVNGLTDACKRAFSDLHHCEVHGYVVDPNGNYPPGPYFYGNDGCWGCNSAGYPALTNCDRCSPERLAYETCD